MIRSNKIVNYLTRRLDKEFSNQLPALSFFLAPKIYSYDLSKKSVWSRKLYFLEGATINLTWYLQLQLIWSLNHIVELLSKFIPMLLTVTWYCWIFFFFLVHILRPYCFVSNVFVKFKYDTSYDTNNWLLVTGISHFSIITNYITHRRVEINHCHVLN